MKKDQNKQMANQAFDQKPKNKTGLIVAIIAGVFLVAIGAVGYYFYNKIVMEREMERFSQLLNHDIDCDHPSDFETWQTYTNARFGFEVKAPADFDKFESANGDGVTFSHPDAVSIKAFGANNSEGLTLDQYLDKELSQLQMETPDGKETGINEVNLDGCEGERRAWEYTSPIDGVKSVMEKAVCLKDNVFYVMEMIVVESSYSKYSSVFDEVVFGFRFK